MVAHIKTMNMKAELKMHSSEFFHYYAVTRTQFIRLQVVALE